MRKFGGLFVVVEFWVRGKVFKVFEVGGEGWWLIYFDGRIVVGEKDLLGGYVVWDGLKVWFW